MNLIQSNKKSFQERANPVFHDEQWKNTLVFCTFVLLASAFWALQHFQQKFDFDIPIKVRYAHIPAGIAISGSLPPEITLHANDKGIAYLRYFMLPGKKFLSITVDMDAIPQNRSYYVVDQSTLYGLIGEIISKSTEIKSFLPEKIEINYSKLEQKELPVVINGAIFPASGYLLRDSVGIEPRRVTAYGGKDDLDALHEIQTRRLEYTIADKTWSAPVALQVPEGIQLMVDSVKLSATIEEYTEKTFELPIACVNVPDNRRIYFFPSTAELSVKVGLSRYAQLMQSNFGISVDYNDLLAKNSADFSLSLTQKPSWIDNYRIVPEIVEFLIEQKK